MTTKLTRDEVLRVAELARLELSDAEITRFAPQLAEILDYAGQLQQADTSEIPPTSHPLSTEPAWREDAAVPSIDRTVVLQQAPEASRDAGLFKVPKVL